MIGFHKYDDDAVAYDPTQTSGLRAWWDPDFGVTNTSGKASAMTDRSGGGYTVSYPTAASQPTIAANAINGHTVLTYAANHVLDTSVNIGLSGNVAATLFACVKPTSATASNAVFGFGASGGTLTAFGMWLNALASGQLSLETGGNNGARFTCSILTTWQVFVIRKPAGAVNNAVAYQNGTQLSLISGSSSASTPNVTNTGVRIGAWSTDAVASLFNGQMFAMGMYTGDIGHDEAIKLSNYYKSALLIS